MPSPEVENAFAAVQAYCDSRVPTEYLDQVRVECERRGNSITIVERRPPWEPELVGSDWSSLKIAQLRHEPGIARAGRSTAAIATSVGGSTTT